jgi:hypothetical protein
MNQRSKEGIVSQNFDYLCFRSTIIYILMPEEDARERLIAKCCVLVGLRPGESFALRWGRVAERFLAVREGVYEGFLDTPKSECGKRDGALADGVIAGLAQWKTLAVDSSDTAFVFPSERGTPPEQP